MGDPRARGRKALRAVAVATALAAASIASHAADMPLLRLQNDYAAGRFEAVVSGCEKQLEGSLTLEERRRCLYLLGLAYQRLGRCDEALEPLRESLAIPIEDRQPHRTVRVADERATAQRAIGDCLQEQLEHEEALEAYEDAVADYPYRGIWCGNGYAEINYRDAFRLGVTLEYLHRYDEAVQMYMSGTIEDGFVGEASIQDRVADLYESTGQFAELEAFAKGKEQPTFKRLVELRKLEHDHDLAGLVPALRSGHFGWDPFTGRIDWEPAQAAKLLARHPGEAVRLLKDDEHLRWNSWAVYTLGSCRTREASALLGVLAEEEGARSAGSTTQLVILHALALAGDTGDPVLQGLTKVPASTRTLFESQRAARAREDAASIPVFPPAPVSVQLPDRRVLETLVSSRESAGTRVTKARTLARAAAAGVCP